MSTLLPEGIDHLGDCPFTLFDAIRQGLQFLSWEELSSEERPPKRIWHHEQKLKEHFDEVERKRRERAGVPAESDPDSVDLNDFDLIARG